MWLVWLSFCLFPLKTLFFARDFALSVIFNFLFSLLFTCLLVALLLLLVAYPLVWNSMNSLTPFSSFSLSLARLFYIHDGFVMRCSYYQSKINVREWIFFGFPKEHFSLRIIDVNDFLSYFFFAFLSRTKKPSIDSFGFKWNVRVLLMSWNSVFSAVENCSHSPSWRLKRVNCEFYDLLLMR